MCYRVIAFIVLAVLCTLVFNFFLTSDVEIGFSEVTYNVSEGASVTVTVDVISGTPDQDVTVSLSTMDGTATGKKKTVQSRICVQKSVSPNHAVVKA